MAGTIKDRVYAAAETVSQERTPTVTAVRESAGVSMADASRYLKEWKSDREAATRQIIEAPPAVIEQGQRVAAAIWNEAIKLAGERHAADQTKWEEEHIVLTAEVAELVAAADAAEAAHKDKSEQVERALTEAQSEVAAMTAAVQKTQGETVTAVQENTGLRAKLAAAQATAETLQQSMDAVIAKISATKAGDNRADTKS